MQHDGMLHSASFTLHAGIRAHNRVALLACPSPAYSPANSLCFSTHHSPCYALASVISVLTLHHTTRSAASTAGTLPLQPGQQHVPSLAKATTSPTFRQPQPSGQLRSNSKTRLPTLQALRQKHIRPASPSSSLQRAGSLPFKC
jgi:hypothetical protein